ncbi:hypothetical protein NA57DRAFT_79478 [Rhizodiscina lignyota]|uniref:Trichothecene 3-O-acetyltransferase-like N-terminal domain-containing protein n=1 Tax=Rhizodiscina lignyota TaxID=1504668 RepID=A0A9P4I8S7_9PEZI|nr:hypothetical protein NA57DRAFT_79478 [Rhizodiscina lignyota]
MGFDENVFISGPSFHLDLSALDARHPVHYSRRLLLFRCASSVQRDAQLTALKIGLRALVLRCPILGGICMPLQDEDPPDGASNDRGDWRTIIPDKGVELVVRDLRSSIPSFEELKAADFPSTQLPYNLLVPVPQDIGNDRPFAACKVQFSSINGGTILTWAMSHCVGDGSGNNELFRILSEETRRAQGHESPGVGNECRSVTVTSDIGMDRTAVRSLSSKLSFNIEQHPAYMRKATDAVDPLPEEQATSHAFKATSPEIPVILHIPTVGLTQLKVDSTTPEAPPISTHDALSALMWRTLLLIRSRRSREARALVASTEGCLFMPSDARRDLDIPTSYIGNVVYQLTASLDLETLFSPFGLRCAARAVRQAITAVNPALVTSCIAETKERWVDWGFLDSYSTTGVAMGTDWTSSELYNQDWGKSFGPLVRYRYPDEPSNCIMPKLPDGAAEVLVSVMPEEVDMLKGPEGFGKYLGSP